MLTRLLSVFLFLIGSHIPCAFSSSYNQIWARQIDSLKTQLSRLPDDTVKILSYLELSYKYIGNNNFQAISYGDSAYYLSQKLRYQKGEAIALNHIGLANALQGNYTLALEDGFKALAIHEKENDKEWVVNDLNVIGLIYNNQGNYKEGLIYYNRILAIIPDGKMLKMKGLALSNLGLCQFNLGYVDSAYVNYKKAFAVLKPSGFKRELAFVLDNMADVLINRNEYRQALDKLYEAIDINKEEGNNISLGNNYIKIIRIHNLAGEYGKALTHLDEAIKLADENGLEALKKDIYNYYKLVYSKLGDFKLAFAYSEKEKVLSDSLLTKAQSVQIANLKKVHEFEKLHSELILSDQKVKMQQRMLYVFITGAFLLLALIYLLLKFFRNKIKSNEVLAQMNSEMIAQSERLKQANEQIKKMNDNLEQLIQKRTKELQKQNEKLIEYAHFNAHEIRGPMARLSGLLNLRQNYPDEIDDLEFINRIFEAISELEKKVNEISGIFSEDSSEPGSNTESTK